MIDKLLSILLKILQLVIYAIIVGVIVGFIPLISDALIFIGTKTNKWISFFNELSWVIKITIYVIISGCFLIWLSKRKIKNKSS